MNFQDVGQQEGRKFVLLGTGATTPVLLFSGKKPKDFLIAEQNFQPAPRVKICMAIVELHCLIKLLPIERDANISTFYFCFQVKHVLVSFWEFEKTNECNGKLWYSNIHRFCNSTCSEILPKIRSNLTWHSNMLKMKYLPEKHTGKSEIAAREDRTQENDQKDVLFV